MKKKYGYFLLMSCFISCSSSMSKNIIEEEAKEKVEIEEEVEQDKEGIVALDEKIFYTEPKTFATVKNLKEDYNIDNDFDTDDSSILQNAIDEIESLGGGKLIIPAGNYSFAEVSLKSNIHLEIDSGVVIRPADRPNNRNYVIFKVTNDTSEEPLRNVSICGVNGKFKVDLRHANNLNVRIIMSFNVSNFKYSNMIVEDKYSKFSSVTFNGVKIGDKVLGPRNGVVKDIDLYNSDYGYGVVQFQLGKHIYFKNLYGKGGATLRIETHNKVLREIGAYDVVDEIYGTNIISEEGNAALMLSPHFINNGTVNVNGVTAIGSGFAVRIGAGFVNKEEAALGLTAGTFNKETVIKNVKATYSDSKAQIKPKHYKYMPCELRSLISNTPINPFPHGDSYNGPSIGAVVYDANYTVHIKEEDITIGEGFKEGVSLLLKEDAKTDTECGL